MSSLQPAGWICFPTTFRCHPRSGHHDECGGLLADFRCGPFPSSADSKGLSYPCLPRIDVVSELDIFFVNSIKQISNQMADSFGSAEGRSAEGLFFSSQTWVMSVLPHPS